MWDQRSQSVQGNPRFETEQMNCLIYLKVHQFEYFKLSVCLTSSHI